ncbi:hypothetical protein EPUS_03557 [Endocarpon pusillum Z07020]|uniref:long-chain-alcohol oxidase n=1 Tax=Endocarpon pusillum (strain Z07020 / HMAS-L-300199) TaxID=1263415 RepID=U1HIH1_ENDPU|nr:uncharacterized protein EPUS_03557 [Endocarpon pusillum Z07020]ERF70005.1 hypothetical protein EPUS_03557 [Endocarpon pusillum Z07020]
MEQPTASMLAALETPLASLPADEVFTPEQWEILIGILDTFVPSITNSQSEKESKLCVGGAEYAEATLSIQDLIPSSADPFLIPIYLSESASSIQAFRPSLQRLFCRSVPAEQLKGLRFILSSLSTRAGSLLLTGSTTLFHLQPPTAREQILISWSKSYLPILRSLFRSFAFIAKTTWISLSPTLPEVIGFPAVPRHGKRGEDYSYEFLDFSSPDSPSSIETDVIIVGSGCGAGVCAKNLAEAGISVLVAEKGYYFPSTHYPMKSNDANANLMEKTAVLAGSCFGGGGTVNWSASLQPQHYVRQEWADQGLPFFTSGEFQKCLDKVCGEMGVATKGIQHNFANRSLLEGSRKLGYHAKEVPQNTGGKEHYCGYCTYGCAGATKNGPAVCFFPAAAKAGAKFIQGFDVRQVHFHESDGKKIAVGVNGLWTQKGGEKKLKITVKAKKVVICAGTLNSPLLLMRSGLKNPNIGRNLHLHPATIVCARFEETVNPWEGMNTNLLTLFSPPSFPLSLSMKKISDLTKTRLFSFPGSILTSACTSFEDLDSAGHGCKIECQTAVPTYILPFYPWQQPPSSSSNISPALAFKTRCASFHHSIAYVVFARDRDTGSVYPDPTDGRIRIKYTTSRFDTNNLVEGVIAAAKIAFVMGAEEVSAMHPDLPIFVRTPQQNRPTASENGIAATPAAAAAAGESIDEGINNPAFQDWLALIRRTGISTPDPCLVGSAHQMGTCRMSADAKNGVVDPRGKVWGVDEGLYVADASVFPSASGVNPMVTNMGIAEWISRGIIREGKKGSGQGVGER